MKEDFLHYVWEYKLFPKLKLKTTKNQSIKIVNSGLHNKNTGPDFLNALLLIDDLLWAGNVEIHIKSSDWYLHHHEIDLNYDTVILHVVWEDDMNIYSKNNQMIPTLVLKELLKEELLATYRNLYAVEQRWIPCEKEIAETNSFVLKNWFERLYFERLEQKSIVIERVLIDTETDYEATLFQLLCKNFGLKINGDAFLELAKSIDFSIIRKERFDVFKLSALLFGQAGFLSEKIEDSYHMSLKEEYSYLKHKYQLVSINNKMFQFFRMRPNNFPTIRLAQIIALYHAKQNLFSELMNFTKLEEFYEFFSVDIPEFWMTHYTFDKVAPQRLKKITKSFVDLVLINTIIPLKFMYLKNRGDVEEEQFLDIMLQLKPEKNAVISKFIALKIPSQNAFETQALLQLKNNYCAKKRCLQCAIGNKILNRN